ncbi:replication restart DNA helicase PriA [Solimonas aquatica]|uniref:Replication restart protein PriA n=1 Tax=Solimonas aquatica TaxID=489703 RepID=A0A1H9KYD8_9GAMM|nr:primosomal protein N' [Solimonas aquatica]SER03925.1 replication restart DNA helicase PriA [Solimonas aquatica]
MLLSSIALDLPLPRLFDYAVPEHLAAQLRRGMRVRVPFGRRQTSGIVVRAPFEAGADAGEHRLIEALIDDSPLLPAELLSLCEWAADYYHHPLGEVLAAALPGSLKREGSAESGEPLWQLSEAGRAALAGLPERQRALRAALQTLAEQPRRGKAWAPAAQRQTLLERGWARCELAPAAPAPYLAPLPLPELTEEQSQALAALQENGEHFHVSLLDGVTGSGKTELYLRRIAQALAAGRQALLLVPEIGLTPQLQTQLAQRFGEGVASFHSGLSAREREKTWLAARAGSVAVVVGTRSAVFVPFARLGLIVVDEEHDTSFKQQDGFRYSARDLAVVRAQRAQLPVILGSATPALESLHNARAGRYRHIRLTRRVQTQAPPQIRVLDVRGQQLQHGLSEPLLLAIDRCLEKGEQALLFINRRGYAPLLLCHACGWRAPCTHCDAQLTVHRTRGRLICHHCGWQQSLPRECPSCGGSELISVGQGTERIEQALANRYPRHRVERLDSDRLSQRSELDALLADIRARRIDILVGTQILAKGHDFPSLSLVGIVSADQALYGADFRAIERMGQMLTQVAGRAGRSGQAGEVWLQTHEPEHPLLRTLIDKGYHALSDELLLERQAACLPPYSHLALLRAEAQDAQTPLRFLTQAREHCLGFAGVQVMEPIPSGMERRAGYWRAQLLLQAAQRSELHRALAAAVPQIAELPGARRLRWSVDVDPADLF